MSILSLTCWEIKWYKYRYLIMICSYHAFRNTPLAATDKTAAAGFQMKVVAEETNPNGYVDSLLVIAPPLAEIHEELRSVMTRQDPRPLTVADIAAKPIGWVPSQLSSIVQPYISQGKVSVKCYYLGRMVHHGQIKGGGPKLECFYVIEYTHKFSDHSLEKELQKKIPGKFQLLN